MKKLYMTRGLPASGKTTAALQMLAENPGNVKRVNKDDLRSMIDGGRWSQSNEKLVLQIRDAIITTALAEGKHVICDDTNLVPKHEERLRQLAKEAGAEFQVMDFTHVDVEECIERDRKRPNYVGEKVIREMHRKFLAKPVEPVPYDPKLPDCIIVDVDGTVALMKGRSPFEWHRVGEDLPNENVIRLVAKMSGTYHIIFVSGRKDVCRKETEYWLLQHFGFPCLVHMRRADDDRDDVIVKREIYEQHIKGRYNVRLVLDDRAKVVRMFRQQGLTVLQCNDGDF